MFLKMPTTRSTDNYSDKLSRLKNKIAAADAIVIGAGAGLSTSAGFDYSGERFEKYFADFHKKYGITDMYSGGFYPFETLNEYWAWWSRHILVNRYNAPVGKPYSDLLKAVSDKDYFVLTTNVDHRFQLAGFDKKRLFNTQGDYGLWQCSEPCCNETFDNENAVRTMVKEQCNMKIPDELIPRCPHCGKPMAMNLRCDNSFVQDEGWHAAAERYEEFIRRHRNLHILFLELGVGFNTPGIIKYPFMQMTAENPKAIYACINMNEAYAPGEIADRAICIDGDIGKVIENIICG
ncbi:MAG: Sir2 silent information regulator family NAD-dependent deacetylase [Ruminiclostridium sp.]|nr:Sir2 silent information regulator family NAD-dependent deacetylase [Ruminiclostridium sp.]